ncbi:Transcription factor GATA-6 [Gaertneriomyces sp. JEL0708]|nr:Transcription factor GATA-6 [Gaertneriomyces sp. JEL0708]
MYASPPQQINYWEILKADVPLGYPCATTSMVRHQPPFSTWQPDVTLPSPSIPLSPVDDDVKDSFEDIFCIDDLGIVNLAPESELARPKQDHALVTDSSLRPIENLDSSMSVKSSPSREATNSPSVVPTFEDDSHWREIESLFSDLAPIHPSPPLTPGYPHPTHTYDPMLTHNPVQSTSGQITTFSYHAYQASHGFQPELTPPPFLPFGYPPYAMEAPQPYLPTSAPQPISCANCHTTRTSLWRRDKASGLKLCNACKLFRDLHGVMRPESLWKAGYLKRRKRKGMKGKKAPN